MWDPSAVVPLFFSGLNVCAQEIDTPVSTGSLLPTLLEMVGIQPEGPAEFASLAPAALGYGGVEPAPVFSEVDYGLWCYRPEERRVMVRDGRWKLVEFRDALDHEWLADAADAELYDLEADPGEFRNLAGDPAHAETVAILEAEIDRWDKSRRITRPTPTAQWRRRWERYQETGELR
jgi:choline-sulfatase